MDFEKILRAVDERSGKEKGCLLGGEDFFKLSSSSAYD